MKAFRDGQVVEAWRRAAHAKVGRCFDSLLPSKADELLAAGDSSRCARPPKWSRAAPTSPCPRPRAGSCAGAEDEPLEAVEVHASDFAAAGIAARVRLAQGRRRRSARQLPRRADPENQGGVVFGHKRFLIRTDDAATIPIRLLREGREAVLSGKRLRLVAHVDHPEGTPTSRAFVVPAKPRD